MFNTINHINQNDKIIVFIKDTFIEAQVSELNTSYIMSNIEIEFKIWNTSFVAYWIYKPPNT
ncbi:Hypothetical protein CINCED_3A005600, partial [Cinara cedri]